MPSKKPKPRVREPVQVYLDQSDRMLLEDIADKMGLTRAEVLRRGLRRLADRLTPERAPGWSIDTLTESLEGIAALPEDLAENHDKYLYDGQKGDAGRTR